MIMTKIEISYEYLETEQKKNGVLNWVKAYCKRNKIQMKTIQKSYSGWERDLEDYFSIEFKSGNQANCFVRNGNNNFPYFEFI